VPDGQGLARQNRVRRRPEFERAYSEGIRIHGQYMTVFVVPNSVSRLRLGVAATRKIGPATVRNRAKRLAREVFRRHKIGRGFDAEPGLDIVVVPRPNMVEASFLSLEADYLSALDRRGRSSAQPRPRRDNARRTRGAKRI
jgi:ribonuclease P protein component